MPYDAKHEKDPKESGLIPGVSNFLKWWLGSGQARAAADDLADRDAQVRCVESGGTWDSTNNKCIMPE